MRKFTVLLEAPPLLIACVGIAFWAGLFAWFELVSSMWKGDMSTAWEDFLEVRKDDND